MFKNSKSLLYRIDAFTAIGKTTNTESVNLVGYFPNHSELDFCQKLEPSWTKNGISGIWFNPDITFKENILKPDKMCGDMKLETNAATCEILALALAMEAVKLKGPVEGYDFHCSDEYARNCLAYLHCFYPQTNWKPSFDTVMKHTVLVRILAKLEATLRGDTKFFYVKPSENDWRQIRAQNFANGIENDVDTYVDSNVVGSK